MSNFWFLEGLRKGRKTESFPLKDPLEPPMRPSEMKGDGEADCPTDAIADGKWEPGKCIFCRRCEPAFQPSGVQSIFKVKRTDKLFRKSIYLYKLDSGSCGACNVELGTIFDPQYDANRLNIFMTNTPRHADAIVIMGVYTEGMAQALKNAYEAMPEPKIVIALGACAISGGILGKSPEIPADFDVEIAGCPPSPYTLLKPISRVGDEH